MKYPFEKLLRNLCTAMEPVKKKRALARYLTVPNMKIRVARMIFLLNVDH